MIDSSAKYPLFSETEIPSHLKKYHDTESFVSSLTEESIEDAINYITTNFKDLGVEYPLRAILHFTSIRPKKWKLYAKLWVELQKKFQDFFNFDVVIEANPAFGRLLYEECLEKEQDFVTKEIIEKSLKGSAAETKRLFSNEITKEDILRGYEKESIEAAIKCDDVDAFKNISRKDGFDFNMQVKINKYETVTKLKKIDLLSFAAYYGSINTFNELLAMIKPNEITAKFAVRGLNMQIIEKVKSSGISLQRTLKPAVQYNSIEIADFILSNYKTWEAVKSALDYCNFFTIGMLYYVNVLRVNINEVSDFGKSSMFKAASCGSIPAAMILVEKGADVNSVLIDDYPIHAACKSRSLAMVKFLANKNADVTSVAQDGSTSLMFAVKAGDLPTIKFLLEKYSNIGIEKANAQGFTALHYAALSGRDDITSLLLSKGADINAKTLNGASVLHLAAKSGNMSFVEELIKNHKELDVNYKTKKGKTTLHYAIKSRNLDLVKYIASFIEGGIKTALTNADSCVLNAAYGTDEIFIWLLSQIDNEIEDVDINALSVNKNETVLHICTENNFVKSVALLLKRNADTSIEDQDGKKPISIACVKGYLEISKMLFKRMNEKMVEVPENVLVLACKSNNLELVKFIVENFKDYDEDFLNAKGDRGANALMRAAGEGSLEIVKYLESKGVSLDEKDKEQCNPLMNATKSGSDEIVEFLIKKGIDVNQKDVNGITALHYAANHGRVNITRMLVEANADPNVHTTKNNYTPLHYACQKGYKTISDFLLPLTSIDVNDTELFMLAARTGCTEVVMKMLELGINVNVKAKGNSTALHEAFEYSHLLSVNILFSHGANSKILNDDGARAIDLATDEFKRQFLGPPTAAIKNQKESTCCLLI